MFDVPTSVTAYILSFLRQERSLAYLLVSKDGYLSTWGGQLSTYGFLNLQQGEKAGKQAFFLEGLLPLEDVPLFFPCMKITSEICADVHLFPSEEGDWVLLLDATWDEMHIAIIQQQINHSNLLQEKF
ncbi:hypothetical protein F7734_46850 [Scytonema sp. UIC 10036]|uniref:hypothetical protein n=1 Tax=Scytonema sp. UIC 10036 TaxID=2304196 RepID=UPI0012DAE5AF|nr:hypothetical protein [Scytonema sp. UIC 10036]MUG99412.1 hypothetical protein [Scytonema sp. UIC 10036]